MPNGKTHKKISTVAGAGLGIYMARGCPTDTALVRISACLAGTVAGGALPDLIEPGVSSWHRQTAHSVAVGCGLAWMGLNPSADIRGAVNEWRQSALQARELRLSLPDNHPDWFGLWLKEMGFEALAALVPALALGYVLHLAADATTPRGLPMI